MDEDVSEDVRLLTDWFTDELFQLDGALVVAPAVSRLVVDVERFRSDADEPMSRVGMGAVYTRGVDGRDLWRNPSNREGLLARYYDPHHLKLSEWAEAAMAEHGIALLIDAHSFPSTPLPCDADQSPDRPDFCFGAGPNTPEWLVSAAMDALPRGFTTRVNEPYAGTMVPQGFAGDERLASIMVEVNRRMYMDESTCQRHVGFPRTKAVVGMILNSLVRARQG